MQDPQIKTDRFTSIIPIFSPPPNRSEDTTNRSPPLEISPPKLTHENEQPFSRIKTNQIWKQLLNMKINIIIQQIYRTAR